MSQGKAKTTTSTAHIARKRTTGITLATALLAILLSPASSGAKGNTITTTIDDQTSMAVTVYNANIGLVKDQRKITIPAGMSELKFADVASQIIPTSVYIKSLTNPGSMQILEQNYEYDLLNPQKLLDKYVGKEVKLYQKNPYTEREEEIEATLLSTNNATPVFKIGTGITFGHPGRIIFPSLPEDLISRPTLLWLLQNKQQGPRQVEVSYLTNNIGWRADYILTLNDDTAAGINGWVTIDNKSGTTYRDASIKLVAGDINRAKEQPQYRAKTDALATKPAEPQFREESFFEYHIYTLQRPSTIKNNQTKQISLITAEGIPVKKELILQGARQYYYGSSQQAETSQKISVYVQFRNEKANSLGIPLPKGIIRVYKSDPGGSMQFIGEDSIDHTPKDEKVRIKLGEAFDVTATRKQTDWHKMAHDTYEAAFEVSIRNHKDQGITVKVLEPIPGDWKILTSSHEYKKADAFTAEFDVPVQKDEETTLTYRVRMRY